VTQLLSLPQPRSPAAPARAKALVFEDPASHALLERADRVADSDAPVLIVGETGTGKELLARHVHARSRRRGPFVAVNCGALAPTLVEAELFGHEAGAYTGAGRAQAGWFEAAHGGTLFLDEIGELPLAMQVKLLRVLQERQVVRLGSRAAIDIDVRIVAATHLRLEQAVAAGSFRGDLYYRLHVAQLDLAPLAERPLDIQRLAQHFLDDYAQRLGIAEVWLAPDALQALRAHPWPGNIRELENVIHCALLLKRGGVIGAADLDLDPGAPGGRPPLQARPAAGGPAVHDLDAHIGALAAALRGLFEGGGPRILERVERMAISQAYDFCGNNQVHTADLLDITRNVLRTHLKRHGLLGRGSPLPADPLRLLPAADDAQWHAR
jgi:sigma-54-specific transcriptional regulator